MNQITQVVLAIALVCGATAPALAGGNEVEDRNLNEESDANAMWNRVDRLTNPIDIDTVAPLSKLPSRGRQIALSIFALYCMSVGIFVFAALAKESGAYNAVLRQRAALFATHEYCTRWHWESKEPLGMGCTTLYEEGEPPQPDGLGQPIKWIRNLYVARNVYPNHVVQELAKVE